jgi:hypothetical protein
MSIADFIVGSILIAIMLWVVGESAHATKAVTHSSSMK